MFSVSFYGKKKRIERIMMNNRMVIVPVDDSLIFGPLDGLANLSATVNLIANVKPSAILGYKGSFSLLSETKNGSQIPFILNITASTSTGRHIQKIKSGSVQEALIMGADCVAAHVNYTSEYENEMIHNLASIISDADRLGLPVLAIAYPRRSHEDGRDDNYENEKNFDQDTYTQRVCRCVRTSAELGADIIKTQYTGSIETFKKVVTSAIGRPVIIAGGPMQEIRDSYKMAKDAIEAGAAGISYGRNVFNAENIVAYLAGIKAIVFQDVSVNEALDIYKEVSKDV